MILIPEVKILEIFETVLKAVEVDFHQEVDESNTLLYKIFGTNQINKFNFYEQAKDIFLRQNDHPRKIGVRMMFDSSRAHLPTVHITMPSETPSADGIGVDEGYQDDIVDFNRLELYRTYTRAFDSTYNCIITSDNATEVLCIYHLVKSMLISIFDTIEFSGIRNIKLSGQDLQINSDLVPTNLFVRGVGINCMYEQTVPAIQKEYFIKMFKSIYSIDN